MDKSNIDMVYNSLYTVQNELNRLHGDLGHSWREIANMAEYKGISHATLSAIARGREPKSPEIRRKLKLPRIINVELQIDGNGNVVKVR